MKTRSVAEFGDFQTPPDLAARACARLGRLQPRSIIEPTCGRGSFVRAAAVAFPQAERVLGFEINLEHLRAASRAISHVGCRVSLQQADFFATDWPGVLKSEHAPWLVIGNPPWVTSAELGAMASTNVPKKSNFQGRRGFDAITGKANFDISEWMLLKFLNLLENQVGAIAVMCKTAVARKVLTQAWSMRCPIASAAMFKINALVEFGAAVDACFFVLELGQPAASSLECLVYNSLEATSPTQVIGFDGHQLISDLASHERTKSFGGGDAKYVWRSGVKHDCSKIMELRRKDNVLINGLNEKVEIERELRFPLLKGSDIGNGRTHPRGDMVITQRTVGESTDYIQAQFPFAWSYLLSHAELLDRRGSLIYKKSSRFAIFGVGGYTFSSWKVAICGFYKKLDFTVVGPVQERPVVFDDTVYFLACGSELEAQFVCELLSSQPAQDFYTALVHWDEKRPITVGLLKRLSLRRVSEELGMVDKYESFSGSLAFAKAA